MDLSAGTASKAFLPGEGFLVVDLDEFQGPLDLLLHLIRQQDIDIFDIPIHRITEQFLTAVKDIRAGDLDNAGEFLEMAASLVRIKAQMLLPRREEAEEMDPRAELVRRLLEYELIREISSRLESAEAERGRRFGKGYVPPRPRSRVTDTPLKTTWEEVFEHALEVELPDRTEPSHQITTRPVAMEDKIQLILETLQERVQVEFSRLLGGVEELEAKMHGVMTLLASLELSRRRTVMLRQIRPFADLWLYRRDEEDEIDDDDVVEARAEEPAAGAVDEAVDREAGEGADALPADPPDPEE